MDFLDTLSKEQRDMIENEIFKDVLWIKHVVFTDDDIKEYVDLVIEANDQRRLADLNYRINNNDNPEIEMTNERDALLNRLRHKYKEE